MTIKIHRGLKMRRSPRIPTISPSYYFFCPFGPQSNQAFSLFGVLLKGRREEARRDSEGFIMYMLREQLKIHHQANSLQTLDNFTLFLCGYSLSFTPFENTLIRLALARRKYIYMHKISLARHAKTNPKEGCEGGYQK